MSSRWPSIRYEIAEIEGRERVTIHQSNTDALDASLQQRLALDGHVHRCRRFALADAHAQRERFAAYLPAERVLFAGTALEVTTTTDFESVAWRKLCLNAAGALSALTLQPARVMHDERIAEVARELVRECIAVGRAEGAVLEDALVESVVQSYRDAPPDSVNSLHADRAAGRPLEIDARNGVIVRLGRKHGIPTP